MANHRATIAWKSDADAATMRAGRYTRKHTWTFDGGAVVDASSSPSVVPLPYSDAAGVDPEEALVASLSSCHMLTFLHEARKLGFAVRAYNDEAVGEMAKNERGVPWVSKVVLRPVIAFSPERSPSAEELAHLHHLAHENCFIAQSVRTVVEVADAAQKPQ